MRRLLFVAGLAALACGSVKDKQECSASTQCPAGQYCARAGGESRCWADTAAPVVTSVVATCGTSPCLRDGTVHVQATITDDHEVLDASVSLDLEPTRTFAMTRGSSGWSADVPLRALPFEAFSRDVVATVTARDGARTASAGVAAGAIPVTRMRWSKQVDSVPGLTVTPPAVMSDGTVVLGGSNAKLYFVAMDGTDSRAALTVGTGQITAAPAVGQHAIWVGNDDGVLYAVRLDGSALVGNVGISIGGTFKGSLGVRTDASKEWAFGASTSGFVGASSNEPAEHDSAAPVAAFGTGPVIGLDGRAYAATGTATAALCSFALTTSPAISLAQVWSPTPSVGVNVAAPLAVDGSGAIWTGAPDGRLSKTVPGETTGTAAVLATLPGSVVDSPVILSSGDVVVGDQTGLLHRYSSAGAPAWSTEPNLGAAVHAPMVLTGGSAALLVPTAAGKVYALAGDGATVWETTLSSGAQLRAGNIFTPSQPRGGGQVVVSYAYFSSANGHLYSLQVDGELDAAAPWPKAFHDPRNTNRAGAQP